MKKQIILGSLIALTGIANAQWTPNGNNVYKTINAGFVGIGTVTPTYKLDIFSTETDGGIRLSQNTGGAARLILKNNTAGGIEWSVNSLGSGNSHGAGNFSIYDNASNSRFFIQGSNGNTGIGTTTPGDKLQVGNGFEKLVFGSASSAALNYGTSYLGFNAARQSGNWTTAGDGAHNGGSAIFGDVFGNIYFSTIPSTGGVSQSLTDVNVMNSVNLRIKNGNVIIGKKSSISHSNALLHVDGIIASQALFVTASGDWADYVFASDYKMPNLYDIETYYKANKHLPEIPSAADVATNGINVGEMNVLLLKKIEELTILMVKQQKEIDELKIKNK